MSMVLGPLCRRLGMSIPVVQAPIGSASTPELAAAVSQAGGLGSLALTWVSDDRARSSMRRTKELTDRSFAVNLVLQWPAQERLALCLDEGVAVVSTFWGDPSPYVDTIHEAGALHVHTVASADEARRAVDAGVDAIVAQGWEAGGHVWGEVTTMALVPAVVDAVAPVPVLAAGGISDGRGLAAALVLGAEAAWMGTRFLLADEADAHPDYRAAIVAAGETDTVHGIVFDGGWPDAPHRALRNSTVRRWEAAGRPPSGHRPGEGEALGVTRRGRAMTRYGDDPPVRDLVGDVEPMAMYAGQGVAVVGDQQPAAAIVRDLAAEAARVLVEHAGTGQGS